MKNARVRNEISPQGNKKCAGQGMKNIESRNEKPPKGNEKCRARNKNPPREMKNAQGKE
jgi:hypothetical protein